MITTTIWVCDCGANKAIREIPHGKCIHCHSKINPYIPKSTYDELLEAAKAAFLLLEKNGYYVTPLTPTMEKLEKAITKEEVK